MKTADFGPVEYFKLSFPDNLFTLFNICKQTKKQFFDNPRDNPVDFSEHIK